MRFPFLLAVFAAFFLAACGGDKPSAVDTVYTETQLEGTVDKTVAQMSVEGMMCELSLIHI